eukprot:scaffold6749_cov162-Amphora_coffeaeformis.AAC.9
MNESIAQRLKLDPRRRIAAPVEIMYSLHSFFQLEVIGHDGKAYNVTMEPGDMVLYESHSILHGRPFPLKGRFMANIFV